MKHLTKNFIIVLLIFLTVAGIFALLSYPGQEKKPISLTELVQDINQGKVKEITVSGNDVSILYQNDTEAKSKKETEIAFSQSLLNYGVTKENLQKIKINFKLSEKY